MRLILRATIHALGIVCYVIGWLFLLSAFVALVLLPDPERTFAYLVLGGTAVCLIGALLHSTLRGALARVFLEADTLWSILWR